MKTRNNSGQAVRTIAPAIAAAALLLSVVAMSGCYERVVKAKGLGADSVTVHDPYQENSKLDNWLFGKPDGGTRTSTPLDR